MPGSRGALAALSPRPPAPGWGVTSPLRPPLQLITVYSLPGMDPDWLIGERGNKKGKVPVTYLELLS